MHNYIARGPQPASILIVGEAPGYNEEQSGLPFVGASGQEFKLILSEAGINMDSCRITNVCHVRPPKNDIKEFFYNKTDAKREHVSEVMGRYPNEHILKGLVLLEQEIKLTQPSLIIAAGDTVLWALTGESGITKWRGSQLISRFNIPCVPIIHPAAIIQYEWKMRTITVNDLRMRAHLPWEEPEYEFTIRPSFDDVMEFINTIPDEAKIAVDIETRQSQIACVGIATSKRRALCIPLQCVERVDGYWIEEEELQITLAIRELFARCKVIGQNFLFDNQYFARQYGFAANVYMDTMLAHHLCFADLPKSLAFLSSMYCSYYKYWKDDGRIWDQRTPEEQLWTYNCTDAVRTFEVAEILDGLIDQFNLREQYNFQHYRLYPAVFKMMLRGMKANRSAFAAFAEQVMNSKADVHQYCLDVVGEDFNPGSNDQLKQLVYDQCKVPIIKNKKTGMPTLNKEAIEELGRKEPIVLPLMEAVLAYRSLGVYGNNFLGAGKVASNGRFHCSYNMTGAKTYRFSSSEDAFGSGLNLQNIPRNRDHDEERKKGGWREHLESIAFPPVRQLFLPDNGFVLVDMDLERADAQVVAWEADDELLKQIFREGLDLHAENAKLLNISRQMAKTACHAVNYVCKAKTLAAHVGVTVHEADKFIRRWFEIHPNIADWHSRVNDQLLTSKTVSNAFGYRIRFFDRVESLLPEAVAWIGQSTVGLVINHILANVNEQLSDVDILLQVHDSLVMQIPLMAHAEHAQLEADLNRIKTAASVVVPYPDPLIIPVGVKISDRNWGEVIDEKKYFARAYA